MKQDEALLNYFVAIMEENGYYTHLRSFMKRRGYNIADMADMLCNAYEKYAPNGMSVYYFLDSLEDAYPAMNKKETNYITDMVDYVYDHFLWKEAC